MSDHDHPLLSQAAVLLYQLLTHLRPEVTTLEEAETLLLRLSHAVARQAAERFANTQVAAAEQEAPWCHCGARMHAEQRRARAMLLLFGLLHCRCRRYRCPQCGCWRCPGAERLGFAPQQRLTRTLQELITHFGLSWSYHAAAVLLGRVLPGAAVSTKTVERMTKRSAAARQAVEDQDAERCLAEVVPDPTPATSTSAWPAAPATPAAPAWPAFQHPTRVYLGLDGVLVRGREQKSWLEIQIASWWSAWRERPDRRHRRREITDRTVHARAAGWEALGVQVWRVFVARGGDRRPAPEVVVLGDGASGIRSLWEWHFPDCRALLDPWHLWEKVKQRACEVLGDRERGLGAADVVYRRLRRGAVADACELIAHWPAPTVWARERRQKLLAFLQRNQELIADYDALRAAGYLTGSGLTEKANDLVVVPRMKNGKMHWSRAGASAVALLRAHVLNDPSGPLLPT